MPMKAFLSHSSKDKGFVENISEQLSPGTYEIDSQTFDAGLINSQAIMCALERCDMFCLFLSKHSVQSPYVDFETLLGIEFLARGGVRRFLTICLDEDAFAEASKSVKFFNIVRRIDTVDAAARLIQGSLVSASTSKLLHSHPFLGRRTEMDELERQATDPGGPLTKALYVSGNSGAGRKTIARKFYEDQYPAVGPIFPQIKVEPYSGLEEIYRRVLTELRPSITASELKTRAQAFTVSTEDGKRDLIAQLLNSVLAAHEAVFLMDTGGLLTDEGELQPEINEIISRLEGRPHPPVVMIAPRMIPRKLRRRENDLAYLGLRSLSRESSERLMSRLLKDQQKSVTLEQLQNLTDLADGHPYNFYQLIDEIKDRGVTAFLANPTDFIEWKHRQSSEYLTRIKLRKRDVLILSLLKLVPELDFDAISKALPVDPADASEALLRLTYLHVVESAAERFMLSPALRIAVERDKRIALPTELRTSAIKTVAISLSIRLENGTAPVALVDAAVISALESGSDVTGLAAAFLLPSHHVSLSKQRYDERDYREAIRFSREALKGIDRLSHRGVVAACRYMCLGAARIGEAATFEEGINRLEKSRAANDSWSLSNVSFLKGFNYRMMGRVLEAEEAFRRAYELSPGNSSAARELAAISLERGNLPEAEQYAREAHGHAPSNPYLLDILISVLIRKYGRAASHRTEIDALFTALEATGEEAGRSFYTTRRAEFEHIWGDNKAALGLIEEAVNRTPHIFEPKRLYVEYY